MMRNIIVPEFVEGCTFSKWPHDGGICNFV